jgi:predicted ATPase
MIRPLRLKRLAVHNFKCIDSLELDLPAPRFDDEPDVLVLGSRNGAGKTSVLEAIVLLYAGMEGTRSSDEIILHDPWLASLIRAGHQTAKLKGEFEKAGAAVNVHITIRPSGEAFSRAPRVSGSIDFLKDGPPLTSAFKGELNDPLQLKELLYFHSYRRISHGGLQSGRLLDGTGASRLKTEIFRMLVSQAELIEGLPAGNAEASLRRLNQLLKTYAGGSVAKLGSKPDGSFELRISPEDGGPSFPFDGLSSGQKEIIATHFMVWLHSVEHPGMVLIDEPELHLNAEWEMPFIKGLFDLAPRNQYILATHSEDIVASVPASQRMLLVSDGVPAA